VLVGAGNGSDRDGVSTVGVAVKVTVVIVPSAVSGGKHIYTSFASTSVIDAINKCIQHHSCGTIHGLAIVRGTPTARVNLGFVESIVQGFCLLDIRDWFRENTNSCHLGIPCNTDSTEVVPGRCNLSCTSSSVKVGIIEGVKSSWQRQFLVVVKVMRAELVLERVHISKGPHSEMLVEIDRTTEQGHVLGSLNKE